MTASNLPYEPEFEQAYKGMSLFFFFFFFFSGRSDFLGLPFYPSVPLHPS